MRIIKNLPIIIICMVSLACSKEDSTGTDDQVETGKPLNLAPSTPVLISPEKDLECSNSSLNFEWETSIDPENELVKYFLEISEKEDFSNLFKNLETSYTSVSIELEKGKKYYWRVVAHDEKFKQSEYSEIRTFFTEPKLAFNAIPQNPHSEIPQNNSVQSASQIDLNWSCEDEDGDLLTYDVYFGLNNPPQKYLENIENPEVSVSLETGKTYYWYIVAKDPKDARATSPTWKFETQ
ncbi:fibronectin type III domain-containing protein [Christiangramia aestuarii]|uniref:Fibronectin type-III domain-containing protein n=1 Tax=Christiangramia aestuarii TaxID=1028746 RepID=A0A7M3SY15_9FLAO|nr:hypothetical protein [Christiangramia aestuarii]MUP41496.1 hypothetical protein [Christiangramia aestuarii]